MLEVWRYVENYQTMAYTRDGIEELNMQLFQVYCDSVKASWMDATRDRPPPSTVCQC